MEYLSRGKGFYFQSVTMVQREGLSTTAREMSAQDSHDANIHIYPLCNIHVSTCAPALGDLAIGRTPWKNIHPFE